MIEGQRALTFEHFSHSKSNLSLLLRAEPLTSPSSSSSGAETLTDLPRDMPPALTGTDAGRSDWVELESRRDLLMVVGRFDLPIEDESEAEGE